MGKIWSRNASGTYGPQCPEGHGVLMASPDWGDKLWCPVCGMGNGHFYGAGDPRVVEGRSPNRDAAIAAAREESMRVEQERTHTDRPIDSPIGARARDILNGKRPTSQTLKSRAAEPGSGPECLCGCGEHTKGGRFRPGHDARYHAAQKAAHVQAQSGA